MDGQEGSQRAWEANWRVKRPAEGSERLNRGSGRSARGSGSSSWWGQKNAETWKQKNQESDLPFRAAE